MESGTGANAVIPFFTHLTLYHLKFSTVRLSSNTHKILAVSTLTGAHAVLHGAFSSSDDVGDGAMDFGSKQSASVLDLASAALKSTTHAYFNFYASGVLLCAASNEIINHAAAESMIHNFLENL